MTIFYLIRHAERDTVPDLLPGRAAGIRLTDRGRMQAEWIARRLASEPLHHVVSSPLERAVETATPLARDRKLSVQLADSFNEFDFGDWTGKRVSELLPDQTWQHFNRFRSGTRIPGGESAHEVQHRFVGELLRLKDAHPNDAIACISHADPIRLALTYFLGAPIDCFDRLEIEVGSVSVLHVGEWGARVVRLNEVPRA